MPVPLQPASSLAACTRRRAPGSLTSAPKTRVRVSGRRPSGCTGAARPPRRGTAPSCEAHGYKVASGRTFFLSADPIGCRGGSNWYAYADNNPLSETDPSGLWAGIDAAGAIVGGALIGAGSVGVSDLIHWHLSPASHYWAGAAGGAVGGEAALYSGPAGLGLGAATAAAIGGAAGGLTANALTQAADIHSGRQAAFSPGSAAVSTVVGGVTAGVGAKVLPFALSGLSNATKGSIGEATSLARNVARGNLPVASQVTMRLGGRFPRWDWQFQNIFTGNIGIVESKFGTAA